MAQIQEDEPDTIKVQSSITSSKSSSDSVEKSDSSDIVPSVETTPNGVITTSEPGANDKSHPKKNFSIATSNTSEILENKKKVVAELAEPLIKTIPINPLEEMNDAILVATVEELKKTTRHLEIENLIFINFLQANDPSLLEGMESNLSKAEERLQRASMTGGRRLTFTRSSGRYSKRESSIWAYSASLTTLSSTDTTVPVDREGPRINISQKTDLIFREMEEIRSLTSVLLRKYYVERHKLQAELEEMALREADLHETQETLENVFIKCTVEKYIQNKNPAEKFCRFMEECFKKSRSTIEKVRLRTSSLRVQYQKIKNQLAQKKLLGENLQEVDFEQLHIENKHLRKNIDQRNLLLLELKKINGKANLLLSQLKKQLLVKASDLKKIRDEIADKEDKILKFDVECDKVSVELDEIKGAYDEIKTRTETYQVPDVLDYIKTKAELGLTKKNLKIWVRRKQLKEMSLLSAVREMKSISGINKVMDEWFIDPSHTMRSRSLESTFEFEFERQKKLEGFKRSHKVAKRKQ